MAREHARDSSLYATHVESFFFCVIVYLSLRRARQKSSANSFLRASHSILLFSRLFWHSYLQAKSHIGTSEDALWPSRETLKTRGRICMRTERGERNRFHSHRRRDIPRNASVLSSESFARRENGGREKGKRRGQDLAVPISSLFLGAQRRSLPRE